MGSGSGAVPAVLVSAPALSSTARAGEGSGLEVRVATGPIGQNAAQGRRCSTARTGSLPGATQFGRIGSSAYMRAATEGSQWTRCPLSTHVWSLADIVALAERRGP